MARDGSLRLSVALAATGAGAVVIGIGITGSLLMWWPEVWSGLAIELGGGLALVAVVVYLERELYRRTEALEKRVQRGQQQLSSQLGDLAVSLTALRSETDLVRAARYMTEDAAVAQFEERLTADSAVNAIAAPMELNAIANPLYVQASNDLKGIRLAVRLDRREEVVVISVRYPSAMLAGSGRGILGLSPVEFTWTRDVTAAQLIDRIIRHLQQQGIYSEGVLDGALFLENLIRTLRNAIRSRRGDDPDIPPLRGRLIEMFDSEWFITTAGLENPVRGLVLDAKQCSYKPSAPAGFEADTWVFLLAHALDLLKKPAFPPGAPPSSGGLRVT